MDLQEKKDCLKTTHGYFVIMSFIQSILYEICGGRLY